MVVSRAMPDIESLLREKRVFEPALDFAKQANWSPKQVKEHRALGERDPQRFWARMARENVSWFTPWKKVLDWKPPFAKWFSRELNSVHCLDRIRGRECWRATGRAPRDGGRRRGTLTFGQLHAEVCAVPNALLALGARRAPRCALLRYPGLSIAMLASRASGPPAWVRRYSA